MLRLLAESGHEIDMIVPSFLEPVEPFRETYPDATASWICVSPPATDPVTRLRRAASGLVHSSPAWVQAYASPAVIEQVRTAAERSDLVVGFGAAASAILTEVAAPSLLLLFSLPLSDVQRARGSRFDQWVTGRFQARLAKRHSLIALTTPSERDLLPIHSGASAIWLPFPRGPIPDREREPAGRFRLLFIADWNYEPNQTGLEFLMADIMPKVWRRYPATELLLAGKGSDELRLSISEGRVRRWGQYGELSEVADGSTIAILPLLAAGGVRTRLVELLAAGLPVVATHTATGGMDLGPAVVTASPEKFGERLLDILDSPAVADELWAALQQSDDSWPSDEEVARRWEKAFACAIGSLST